MLNSKELLERTGLSRATLNNYVAAGLLPRPQVLPPRPGEALAARLGYFPPDAIERVRQIQRLKGQGWSLARIQHEVAPHHAGSPGTSAYGDPLPESAIPTSAGPGNGPRMILACALAVALKDGQRLWVSLPVHDYFALVAELESGIRNAVQAGGGRMVRRGPDRYLCHFLPSSLGPRLLEGSRAAVEAMRSVDRVRESWRQRLPAGLEVHVTAALATGDIWVAPSPSGEPHLMGDALSHALHMARWAPPGRILVTRDHAGRLAAQGGVAEPGMQFKRLAEWTSDAARLPADVADLPVGVWPAWEPGSEPWA